MRTLELWANIVVKGETTWYDISSKGRIKNRVTGKYLKPQLNEHGYEIVGIRINGERKTKSVHRLVAKAFVDNPDPKIFKEINHIDGNKRNNCSSNLEWTDRSGNLIHAFELGLREPMKGEGHPLHKYSEDQIREACKLMEDGLKNKEIHKKTGIDKDDLSYIRNGRTWTHISKDYNIKPQEGKEHRYSDYTEDKIREACQLMQDGYNNKYVSEKLGISYHVIADIRKGKTWRSISQDYNIEKIENQKRLYTEDQIRKACKLMAEGLKNTEVSEKLGISYDVISDIRRGKSWTHIAQEYDIKPKHEKRDNSQYWAVIDDYLLKGYTRKQIRDAYHIPGISESQYVTLISNRIYHLKKEGKLQ